MMPNECRNEVKNPDYNRMWQHGFRIRKESRWRFNVFLFVPLINQLCFECLIFPPMSNGKSSVARSVSWTIDEASFFWNNVATSVLCPFHNCLFLLDQSLLIRHAIIFWSKILLFFSKMFVFSFNIHFRVLRYPPWPSTWWRPRFRWRPTSRWCSARWMWRGRWLCKKMLKIFNLEKFLKPVPIINFF